MKKMVFIVVMLSFLAVLAVNPDLALADRKYARQLENVNCSQGKNFSYKTGCTSYFTERLVKTKTPNESLVLCKNQCTKWYKSNPTKGNDCRTACQDMKNGE